MHKYNLVNRGQTIYKRNAGTPNEKSLEVYHISLLSLDSELNSEDKIILKERSEREISNYADSTLNLQRIGITDWIKTIKEIVVNTNQDQLVLF